MKKLLLNGVFLLGSLFAAADIRAQTDPKEIRITGSVIDSVSQKGLDFITISLLNDQNVAVKADYTKADGVFGFDGLKAHKYTLRIEGVGYKRKTVMADLSDFAENVLDMGKIALQEDAVGLKEVK